MALYDAATSRREVGVRLVWGLQINHVMQFCASVEAYSHTRGDIKAIRQCQLEVTYSLSKVPQEVVDSIERTIYLSEYEKRLQMWNLHHSAIGKNLITDAEHALFTSKQFSVMQDEFMKKIFVDNFSSWVEKGRKKPEPKLRDFRKSDNQAFEDWVKSNEDAARTVKLVIRNDILKKL